MSEQQQPQNELLRYFFLYIVEFYDEDGTLVSSEEFDDEEEANTFFDMNIDFHQKGKIIAEKYRGVFESAEEILLNEAM